LREARLPASSEHCPSNRLHRALLFALSIVTIASGCAPASHRTHAPAPPIVHLPAPVAARIDAVMLGAIQHQRLPGVSLAIGRRDGTIVYARGYGQRADRDTVYNIASITKQLTAATILSLAQQHRLSIDDPLAKYLPPVAHANAVTLRDLLNHTSGIPDFYYLAAYRPGMNAADIVKLATAGPLRFRPGSAYEYSNTNYVLLGLVIEAVDGVPYARALEQRIFGPARMFSSRVGDVPGDGPDDAVGYVLRDGALARVTAAAADLGYGAGAVDSTAVDLVRWDAALLSGKILRGTRLREMLAFRSLQRGTTVRYAFGLHERDGNGGRELYHRGRSDGYAGVDAIFVERGITIAMLANNESFAPMHLVDEIDALVAPMPMAARASGQASLPGNAAVDARAKDWLSQLRSGRIDRRQLGAAAAARFSDATLGELAERLRAFGQLRSLTFLEKDSRYFGFDYTYRAAFENALVEYRFGVTRDGKIWNCALDRED
jgi:D-alanyl-D-alanine carboxypeptidase